MPTQWTSAREGPEHWGGSAVGGDAEQRDLSLANKLGPQPEGHNGCVARHFE